MIGHVCRNASGPLLAVALLVQAGCNNPQIRRRIARHEASNRWVVQAVMKNEARHPPSLRHDVSLIEHVWERDAARTKPNLEAARRFFNRDWERYDARFKQYRRILEKFYTGHPDHAFDPLVLLF